MILRAIRWAIAALTATFLATILWTFLWPDRDLQAVPEADAILCLGAGVDRNGQIDSAAMQRVRTCAALHLAGKAPLIVMTAGPNRPGSPPGALAMARHAEEEGVPATAILLEPRAQSTLQNTLFSRALLPDARRVIVVTEAFHLPRSWASAHWAGFEEVGLVASEAIRAEGGFKRRLRVLVREALSIWFNAARAVAFDLAGVLGVPEDQRIDWLR